MPDSRWTLTANASGAEQGLRKAEKGFGKLGKQQKSNISTAQKLSIAMAGINQALELGKKLLRGATAVWGTFDKLVIKTSKDVAKLGDSAAKTARAFRVGTDWLQGYRSTMKLAGVDVSVADKALLNIQKTALDAGRGLATAVDLLAMAGVEARDSNGQMKGTATLITEISDNLQSGLIPANEQAALSAQLFRDRSGMLVLGLKEGSSAIVENTKRLEDWGALMGGDLLAFSERYTDSVQRREEAEQGWKNAVAEGTLPTMTALNEALAETIGNSDGMRTVLTELGQKYLPMAVKGVTWLGAAVVDMALTIDAAFLDVITAAQSLVVGLLRSVSELTGKLGIAAGRAGFGGVAERMGQMASVTGRAATRLNGVRENLDGVAEAMRAGRDDIWESKRAFDALFDSKLLAAGAPGAGGGPPDAGEGGAADFAGGGTTIDLGKGKVVELQDVVRQATQEMSLDFGKLGASIGDAFAELVTAEDKAGAAKSVFKKFMTEGIQLIGQYAAQAVSSRTSIMGTNITAAAAETAAQTPAAITGAIASEGANVGLATAAIGAGIAAMTGLISAIGDAGIPTGALGDGQHTVITMGGKERLLGPGATGDVDAMLGMLRGEMAQSLDGRALTGAGFGGSSEMVTVQSDVYLDGEVIARKVSTHQARDTALGIGPFSDFAMGTT